MTELQKQIKELESKIKKYQASYYNGEAEISDAEFDALWDELKKLNKDSPVLKAVGQDSGNFQKISHVMPMGSQEKASSPEEFLDWASKHVYEEYLVEYKLDGASLELQYEDGKLLHAVTRGDGSVGDDITNNALKMKGVIESLAPGENKVAFTGGIRGEVIMTHEVHDTLFKDKANCRNAANGLMKRKDGEGSENLSFISYDAFSTSGEYYKDEEGKILWLKSLGFEVSPLMICKNPQEVIDYRAKVMDERKSIPYDIDGLVIKERVINQEDAFRNRPDRQIAFKFSLEEAVSVLRSVEWSINGATYTPVAIFDEVPLNGTKVSRASLANPDTMKALGVKLGSKVSVVKRGEIIPKIQGVLHQDNEEDIPIPCTCEECGSSLINEGTRLYCPNKNCSKRVLHQILKWVNVIDIRDLGETLIVSLFKDGVLKSLKDIYTLTEETLVPYFLNEESISKDKESKGAQKVLRSIQNHREMSLQSFVAGLDIEGIGETTIEKLINAGYTDLNMLMALSEEEIASVYGFAEVMAHTLRQGFVEYKEDIEELLKYVSIKSISKGSLTGLSFCFTGELHTMKRQDAEKLVKSLGGTTKSSVTKDLSYLVTNDTTSGSSKNVKAQKYGVKVIDEEAFIALTK